MSQLTGKQIASLCRDYRRTWLGFKVNAQPMISPFEPVKRVVNGKSYGLSGASYDCRIAHDLTLGINPAFILANFQLEYGLGRNYQAEKELDKALSDNPPCFALAHTIEQFSMPDNVVGYVCDKSTYARLFVSAFNTLFDPGFEGDAVLELVNFSDKPIELKAGDPICQFAFHWTDGKTQPYRGKYQHQVGAQPAILEVSILDGSK